MSKYHSSKNHSSKDHKYSKSQRSYDDNIKKEILKLEKNIIHLQDDIELNINTMNKKRNDIILKIGNVIQLIKDLRELYINCNSLPNIDPKYKKKCFENNKIINDLNIKYYNQIKNFQDQSSRITSIRYVSDKVKSIHNSSG
jgi:hypothetical protein